MCWKVLRIFLGSICQYMLSVTLKEQHVFCVTISSFRSIRRFYFLQKVRIVVRVDRSSIEEEVDPWCSCVGAVGERCCVGVIGEGYFRCPPGLHEIFCAIISFGFLKGTIAQNWTLNLIQILMGATFSLTRNLMITRHATDTGTSRSFIVKLLNNVKIITIYTTDRLSTLCLNSPQNGTLIGYRTSSGSCNCSYKDSSKGLSGLLGTNSPFESILNTHNLKKGLNNHRRFSLGATAIQK